MRPAWAHGTAAARTRAQLGRRLRC